MVGSSLLPLLLFWYPSHQLAPRFVRQPRPSILKLDYSFQRPVFVEHDVRRVTSPICPEPFVFFALGLFPNRFPCRPLCEFTLLRLFTSTLALLGCFCCLLLPETLCSYSRKMTRA